MGTKSQESIYPPATVQIITASDTTEYDPPLRAISIGTAGDLAVVMPGNSSAVTIPSNCLAVGIQHVGFFKKVMTTNTTATEIMGWR